MGFNSGFKVLSSKPEILGTLIYNLNFNKSSENDQT